MDKNTHRSLQIYPVRQILACIDRLPVPEIPDIYQVDLFSDSNMYLSTCQVESVGIPTEEIKQQFFKAVDSNGPAAVEHVATRYMVSVFNVSDLQHNRCMAIATRMMKSHTEECEPTEGRQE